MGLAAEAAETEFESLPSTLTLFALDSGCKLSPRNQIWPVGVFSLAYCILKLIIIFIGFSGGSDGKESASNAGDLV